MLEENSKWREDIGDEFVISYSRSFSLTWEGAPTSEAMRNNGRRYLEGNMNLEKNVALYEEIFCALTGFLAGRMDRRGQSV